VRLGTAAATGTSRRPASGSSRLEGTGVGRVQGAVGRDHGRGSNPDRGGSAGTRLGRADAPPPPRRAQVDQPTHAASSSQRHDPPASEACRPRTEAARPKREGSLEDRPRSEAARHWASRGGFGRRSNAACFARSGRELAEEALSPAAGTPSWYPSRPNRKVASFPIETLAGPPTRPTNRPQLPPAPHR
jgi:hypothetical protein